MPRIADMNSANPRESRTERLAEGLNAWDHESGRGWHISDREVPLEPPFSFVSSAERPDRLIDNGRIPSRIGTLFSRARIQPTANAPGPLREPPPAPLPTATLPERKNVIIRSYLPSELKLPVAQIEQLISSLAFSAATFTSFEMIGTAGEIVFQISCGEKDQGAVLSQLRGHLPQIEFRIGEDFAAKWFPPDASKTSVAVDFGLGRHWFLPLPFGREFVADPLVPLVAAFEDLNVSEGACLQVMFGRTRHAWQRTAEKAIFDRNGKPVFANLQNQIPIIKEKLAGPLLAVCVRLLVTTKSLDRSMHIARSAGVYLKQFGSGNRNELIPLTNDGLDHEEHMRTILKRTSHRSGMLMTAQELSGIVRFPSVTVQSEKLRRDAKKTKRAPAVATQGTIILGENEHAGQKQTIKISPAHHALVIGGTGTGKSTLLMGSILQNINLGNGCCVVDPHGDLVDDVIARLPDDRTKDTILFDPSDADYPVGFNILLANSETEKTFLASDLVATFRRYSTSWGDVMDAVLSNAVLAFVESPRGGTLFDLKRFLVEKDFRREFLETVSDDAIRYFWNHEYPIISGRTQSSILIRLDTFLRQKLVRNIVCRKDSKLNLRQIFDERKILLVKLSQGLLGAENAWLLGTFLISKIYQIALTRGDVGLKDRPLWPVFIDEAAHFAGTPSMSLILENLRKFGISVTLSTQSHKLLMSKSPAIGDSSLTNAQVRICFRLGDTDAERLASGFSFFDSNALQNLGTGEAIMRIEKAENDFNLRTLPPAPVAKEHADRRKTAIIENTRKNYATPVRQVEEQFRFGRTGGLSAETKGRARSGNEDSDQGASNEMSSPRVEKGPPAPEGLSPEPPPPDKNGRGGAHHKELQAVIKRMAENYGFRAEIEKSLAGEGWIDVSLETDLLRIACEVSVATVDYEVTNIEKCLSAGYDYAIVVASNRKKLPLLSSKLHAALPIGYHHQVKAFDLGDLLSFLRGLSAQHEDDGDGKRPDKPTGQRLNFAEACEMLNKSASTVYRWIREGRLPFYRIGREYEFDRDELLLAGKHNLSGKRRALVKLEPLKIGKKEPRSKKEQDARYRKLLKLD